MKLDEPTLWCTKLATERLELHPTDPRHAAAMFVTLANPRIYTFIEDEPPTSVAELESRYQRAQSRRSPDGEEGWFEWIVQLAGEPIGYAQATISLKRAEIGIAYVFSPTVWGRGYATESGRAIMTHLDRLPGLARFLIDTDVDNIVSEKLARKLGFELLERRVGASTIRGESRDDFRFVKRVQRRE